MTQSSLNKQAQELRERFFRRGVFPIKAGGPIVALDWDGPVLRVAQSADKSGKKMSRYAAERLETTLDFARLDAAAAGAALSQALQRLEIKPGAVVMGIPRGQVFLRTLSLPKPANADELTSMVHFQIGKEIPYRVDEAVIDFQINPTTPAPASASGESGETAAAPLQVEVLVAVVKKDLVQKYEAIAQAAGLKLAALGLDSYANARGLLACGLAGGPKAVALVSLRHAEVIIDIVVGETLVFSRTAALPRKVHGDSPDATAPTQGEGTELINTMTIEVVRGLHSYEGLDGHQKVEEILVTGESGQEDAIVDALSQRYSFACRRLNPAGVLGIKDTDKGAGALSVCGLAIAALDQRQWPYDFLHPKRPPAPQNSRRKRLIMVGTAIALVFCCLMGIRQHLINNRKKIRDDIQAKIEAETKNKPIYREMRIKAKTVSDWALDKRDWLDHYAYLSMLLPSCSDVYVSSISTGSRGMMHLSIQARSGEILAQLDKPLRQAGYDIKPLAITPSSDKFGYSFQSSLEITAPEKVKTNAPGLKVSVRPGDDGSMDMLKGRGQGRRNR